MDAEELKLRILTYLSRQTSYFPTVLLLISTENSATLFQNHMQGTLTYKWKVKIMSKARVIPVVSELKIGFIKTSTFSFISQKENIKLLTGILIANVEFCFFIQFYWMKDTARIELDNILESYLINFHFWNPCTFSKMCCMNLSYSYLSYNSYLECIGKNVLPVVIILCYKASWDCYYKGQTSSPYCIQ